MATLGYAVLELLAHESLTGYEISRRMQRPVGYMWTASHSQVYGELAALQADGHVRHRVIDGPGPRDTKRYSITAAGRRALRDWVCSPLTPEPARSELMLRVRALWLVEAADRRALLRSVLTDHEARLAVYLDEAADFERNGIDVTDPDGVGFGRWATLQAGLRSERATVEWCGWMLAALGDEQASAPVPTGSSECQP